MSDGEYENKWEEVASGTTRLSVDGGWIYVMKFDDSITSCFVLENPKMIISEDGLTDQDLRERLTWRDIQLKEKIDEIEDLNRKHSWLNKCKDCGYPVSNHMHGQCPRYDYNSPLTSSSQRST